MKGYIYKYTFSDNKVYIGQTRRDPEIRHKEHLSETIGPMNGGFWEAYKRLGEPKYEIIETIENDSTQALIEKLNERETYWIQLHKADCKEYGYNRKSQGTVAASNKEILDDIYRRVFHDFYNRKFEEYVPILQKQIAGSALTYGEQKIFDHYWKDNNPFYGKKGEMMEEHAQEFSWHIMITDAEDETDEYIKENEYFLLTEYWSDNAIIQLDNENKICNAFTSFNEIAQYFCVKRPDNVRNVIKGLQKSAYGYNWCVAKDYTGDKSEILDKLVIL